MLSFGHYYRACPIRLGPEAAAQAEKDYLAKGGGKDWKGGKAKGKGKGGKGKGYGKKGVYGVDGGADDAWDEGDPVMWAASAEADAAWAKSSEGVGAVYDQDEQFQEFCGCVDVEDEVELDLDNVPIIETSEGEVVFGVDTDSDDDLIGAEYRGLRDVDGWQRRDPWGGSAGTPRSDRVRVHLYLLLPSLLVFYLRPYILRVSLVRQWLQH